MSACYEPWLTSEIGAFFLFYAYMLYNIMQLYIASSDFRFDVEWEGVMRQRIFLRGRCAAWDLYGSFGKRSYVDLYVGLTWTHGALISTGGQYM